jgi:hypothetical protein
MLRTSSCSRTRHISDATDDLGYLRKLPYIARQTRISGTIRHYASVPGKRFKAIANPVGVKITVTGQGRRYETFTDENGVYEIVGIPPGKYRVAAQVPPRLKSGSNNPATEVDVINGGCAGADIGFESMGVISGRIIDHEGKPVLGIEVELIMAEKANSIVGLDEVLSVRSNEEGYYELVNLPAGSFLIGVNLGRKPTGKAPYPRTFYPGVTEPNRGLTVALAEGDKVENINIHLPSRLETRTIEGVALFSDGTPLRRGQVSFEYPDEQRGRKFYATTRTDKNGRFSITVVKGTTGIIQADHVRLHDSKGIIKLYSEPIPVDVQTDIRGLKVIIPSQIENDK